MDGIIFCRFRWPKNINSLTLFFLSPFLSLRFYVVLQKNKSAKVKAEVARIQQQASMAGKSRDVLEKEKEKALRAKAQLEEEKRLKEEAALLKPVQTQKVPFGVDPKTVLCAFFKAGTCEKGNKCKFSHDVNVGRKVEKKNLYSDDREEGNKLTGVCLFFFGWWWIRFFGGLITFLFTRYYGYLGRREIAKRRAIQSRQSSNINGCTSFLSSITFLYL